MISREMNAQIAAALVGILLLFTIPMALDVPINSTTNVGVLALFYAVVFGGAHLYLALIEEDDADFPVTARWRTVLLVAGLATLAVVSHGLMTLTELSEQVITELQGESLALQRGEEVNGTASGIGVLGILVYWYTEARDGYREARPSDQGSI